MFKFLIKGPFKHLGIFTGHITFSRRRPVWRISVTAKPKMIGEHIYVSSEGAAAAGGAGAMFCIMWPTPFPKWGVPEEEKPPRCIRAFERCELWPRWLEFLLPAVLPWPWAPWPWGPAPLACPCAWPALLLWPLCEWPPPLVLWLVWPWCCRRTGGEWASAEPVALTAISFGCGEDWGTWTFFDADVAPRETGRATTGAMAAAARTNATESFIWTMFNKEMWK